MSNEPARPILIYDGDCAFCRIWIDYWQRLTNERVAYQPFQTAADQFPDIPRTAFESAVHLIWPDGRVTSGAQAVFETLALTPGRTAWLWLYRHAPGFAPISERAYRVVAAHRDFFYWVTRLLWGKRLQPATFDLTRWLFLKALGLVYFFAFLSFALQATGLIGSKGILPVGDYLQEVHAQLGAQGYMLVPTIFWLNAGDAALQIVTWAGVILSVMLILGWARRVVVVLLFVGYLSIVNAGQVFMSFQWDVLLVEAGFLAIFVDFGVTIWLYRLLLFRLMFLSGAVKLSSGDPTWHDLTALNYHFETQPLPTVIGWWMYQLPDGVHRFSTMATLVIELILPFFIFFPRHLRMFAGAGIIFLQVLILLMGNYTFFNLLTIALCLFLFDDAALRRLLPARLVRRASSAHARRPHSRLARRAMGVLAVLLVILGLAQIAGTLHGKVPEPIGAVMDLVEPFHLVNRYGLFAVMTTTRPEIIVEGSNDGENWQAYEFRYKAGDVSRPPLWVAPLQPRLDWQMWFAALGTYQQNPWFINFLLRLLQGSPDVLSLLDKNPFPDHPPRYVRAMLYDYHFTDPATLSSTGAWWRRESIGLYVPPIALNHPDQSSGN
jgi:predicted DCC family thiol-disulfide oxidoreductase YuxK